MELKILIFNLWLTDILSLYLTPVSKKVFAPEKTKINESICNMNILCKEFKLTKRKLY
jgi:hypothetical protein